MRRALGLQGETSSPAKPATPSPQLTVVHPQRRRFVRDGEVPVTMVHREHGQDESSISSQLDVTRRTLKDQTAAREQAERTLAEAQALIRDLQTKLAHERIARDEAIARLEKEREALREALAKTEGELATERERARETVIEPVEFVGADAEMAETAPALRKGRRRRPVQSGEHRESEIVEWWLPGWQDRYR